MTTSKGDQLARILADPAFHAAVRSRARFGWILAGLMCVAYFGFIAAVAFAPQALGAPINEGFLSVGFVLGLFVILAAFVLTAIYVVRANGTFDRETRAILERSR